jgi:hypothetical protein
MDGSMRHPSCPHAVGLAKNGTVKWFAQAERQRLTR